jgi:PiT family inorganic phosphate transporter
MNGFHDAANSIATIVSTGAMRPQQAVLWAAFFNFAPAATQIPPLVATPNSSTLSTCRDA